MADPTRKPACGTRGGYERHRRLGEESCDPCKAAAAEYRRSKRAQGGPSGAERGRALGAARNRAMVRLAELHVIDFELLLREELGEEPRYM